MCVCVCVHHGHAWVKVQLGTVLCAMLFGSLIYSVYSIHWVCFMWGLAWELFLGYRQYSFDPRHPSRTSSSCLFSKVLA